MTAADVDGQVFKHVAESVPWSTILLVGLGVGLVDTVVRWAVIAGVGLWVRPVGLMIAGTAVTVGRPAQWGNAVGLFATATLLGDWAGGVVNAVAAFAATAVAVRLWGSGPEPGPEVGRIAWFAGYAVVALGAVLTFAASEAWLLEVLGRAPFGATVWRVLGTTLPLTVLGAPFVCLAAEGIARTVNRKSAKSTSRRARIVVLTTLALWTVVGYVGSFLFSAVNLVPIGEFGRRVSPVVESFLTLWGPGGIYAQTLLGLLALLSVGVTFRWD